MMVVVCAAGKGSRMGELTRDTPKLLLEVHGKRLLERVLDVIVAQEGVKKIVMVLGYDAEKIKKAIGKKYKGKNIEYVFNELYQTKGNMSSLWAAREHVTEDLVFTVGDVIIRAENARRLFKSEYDASILVDASEEAKKNDDPLKIVIQGRRVVRLEKRLPVSEVFGAACALYKMKLPVAKKFYEIIEGHMVKGEKDLPFNIPIEELCRVQEVLPVVSDGSFCMDIDTPEDLQVVERELKKIEGKNQ